MTVEFDKETEGFVLNKLDSLTRIKTRSEEAMSISEILADIVTPTDVGSKDELNLRDWLKETTNLIRFTTAFKEGYEASETKYKLFTKSTWNGSEMVLIYNPSTGEYTTDSADYVTTMYQFTFKKSELPDDLKNNPWFDYVKAS